MKVLETPTIFNYAKKCLFSSARFKGSEFPRPKWRDFSLWFPRCMGIKVLSLEAKKYWKPRVEMLVFRPPEGENPDPRALSMYLMFCTYLTLYFLNFTFI